MLLQPRFFGEDDSIDAAFGPTFYGKASICPIKSDGFAGNGVFAAGYAGPGAMQRQNTLSCYIYCLPGNGKPIVEFNFHISGGHQLVQGLGRRGLVAVGLFRKENFQAVRPNRGFSLDGMHIANEFGKITGLIRDQALGS